MATLQEMNPLVRVAALPGAPADALSLDVLRCHDLLLLCGAPAGTIATADALCREAGVALYAGVCRGIFGWAFANLHTHRYNVEVRGPAWWDETCVRLPCDSQSPACPHVLLSVLLQTREEQPDGSSVKVVEEHSESFPSWRQANTSSLAGIKKRHLSRLALLIRGKLLCVAAC